MEQIRTAAGRKTLGDSRSRPYRSWRNGNRLRLGRYLDRLFALRRVLLGQQYGMLQIGILLLEVFAEQSLLQILFDLTGCPQLPFGRFYIVHEGFFRMQRQHVQRNELRHPFVLERIANEQMRLGFALGQRVAQ